MLLRTSQLTKDFGGYRVLEDVSLQINPGDRIGLVGKNGAGKTTLVELLTGDLLPDQGNVYKQNHLHIGYLPQQPHFDSNRTLYDEMKQVYSHITGLESELSKLEEDMASAAQDNLNHIMDKYSQVRDNFEAKGGYQIDRNIRSVLKGLGFSDQAFQKPLTKFSGGEKTRALLAQKLLEEPNLLILDEPTNYLDLEGLTWLENYLLNYQGSFLIITHDRHFLETTVNTIWELSHQRVTVFKGNYHAYLKQKQLRDTQLKEQYKAQQRVIKKTEDFIQKNIEGQKTKQAQSRRKQLEKMTRIDKPQTERSMHLRLGTNQSSGEEVINLSDITVRVASKQLFPPLSLKLFRGEKVGIIGPNGSGKTSLLKLMAAIDPPATGSITYGSQVEIGYLDQEQQYLSPGNTLIEELRQEQPMSKEEDLRRVLGRFHFTSEQMVEQVKTLSGGEKVRLALAKLLLKNANLLLLDEPTNHLDITGREALEAALLDYPGTLILVSHDRYLLNKVATKILHLSESKVDIVEGNYSDYTRKMKQIAEQEAEEALQEKLKTKPSPRSPSKAGDDRKGKQAHADTVSQQAQLNTLMEEIDQLELEKKELETALGNPELYKDGEQAKEINLAYQEIQNKLIELYGALEALDI